MIALWALGAYVAACLAVSGCVELSRALLGQISLPSWIANHLRLMTELARGLLPYIAASVVFCLGLGAHLPGTRAPTRPP